MDTKKSPKASLETKKPMITEIGIVVALAFVLFAFNYKSYDKAGATDFHFRFDDTPEEIIPITKPEVKPPPPAPPTQVHVISVVTNDVEVETVIEINAEANQETVIQDYVPVAKVEVPVEETDIFKVVEFDPEYPGGNAARMQFLQENIKYPQMARESGIQGTVYVTFVVETDGRVTDVRVLRGIGGGCDEEAIRVIQSMPKWVPGKQRGKPVRVQFNMPIKFTLQG